MFRVVVELSEGHEVDDLDNGENRDAQEESENAAKVGDEVRRAVHLRALRVREVVVFEENCDSRAESAVDETKVS
jgi:argininosuccinate lyase